MRRIAILLALILVQQAGAVPATQPGSAVPDAPAVVTKTYDVGSLIEAVVDYPLLPSMIPSLPGEMDQGLANPSQQGPLFGGGNAAPVGPASAERAAALTELIQSMIDPRTWKNNGGSTGAIEVFDGRMVVTTTPAIQAEVQNILSSLSTDAARTVKVSAKWVLLTPDVAQALSAASPNAITPIDDKTLSGCKLYCEGQTLGLSGQTVHATCGQEQPYVSNVTPVVGSNAVGYSPTISTVRSGVALQVTPTLADNSVRLDLLSIVGNVSNIGSGPVAMPAANDPTTLPSGSGLLQRPTIEGQQFHTTVELPLSVNVLIGGMSRVPGDQEPTLSQLYLVVRVDAAH